jgi:hypothetical protein
MTYILDALDLKIIRWKLIAHQSLLKIQYKFSQDFILDTTSIKIVKTDNGEMPKGVR